MVFAMAELGRPCGWLTLSPPVGRRVAFVAAVTAGHRKEAMAATAAATTSKRKKKLHRTWTPGKRVSSDKKYSIAIRGAEEQEEHSFDLKEQEHSEEKETASESELDQTDAETIEEQPRSSQLNCSHFARCSGCTLENRLNNPPVFKEATEYFQRRHMRNFKLVPSAPHGWRCRAKLAVRGTAQEPLIGLFEEQTHDIVDIPDCRAHHPSINAAVELVKSVMKELRVQPYDEETSSGQLRYIQVVVNTYITSVPADKRYENARVQVSLVWNSRDERSPGTDLLHEMAQSLWEQAGDRSSKHILHSVWANFQTTQTNIILGQRWRHLFGESQHWERVGGVDICYAPSSFGQANYLAFEKLLRRLQRCVRRGSVVADLYAGVGVIGLSLAAARNCRIVKCVEVNKHCRWSFERSLERFPKSRDSQISWHCADATEAPITWLEGADVVIVDPPRKGLEPAVIEALRTASLRAQGRTRSPSLKENNKVEKRPWILRAKQHVTQRVGTEVADDGDGIWPEQLIYVSCSWKAFREDCEALEHDGRWHLQHAQAFNFFPGTNSIELLAIFYVGESPDVEKPRDGKRTRKLI